MALPYRCVLRYANGREAVETFYGRDLHDLKMRVFNSPGSPYCVSYEFDEAQAQYDMSLLVAWFAKKEPDPPRHIYATLRACKIRLTPEAARAIRAKTGIKVRAVPARRIG